jgi:hypothetical protein
VKKIFTILLAVALVLSFSLVATPVSADVPYAELTVNITKPLDGVDIVGGHEFKVTANVTNNGTWKAKDVKATIEITGNATLKAGQVATKSVAAGEFGVNWTAEVSWDLVCTGAGAVSINVTPSGKDDGTLNDIIPSRLHSDTVNINQKKVLEVTIFAPDGTAFNVTDEFHVTANVKNISSLNATGVKLTISIDRYAELKAGEYATRTVGTGKLNSGVTSTNYTWTLKCTGDGFSRITVSPSGKVEGEDIPADALTAATVTVSQGVFDVASITLVEGWNLISLPLIPLDSAIDAVVAGIMDNVISVWHYNAAAKHWYSFAPGASSDLSSMKDGKAYWINMEAAQTLNLAGSEMPKGTQLPPTYDVVVGWNMVGFKSTATNVTAEDYLDGTEYVRIYWFENGTWFTIPGPPYDDPMEPGHGYWVAFTAPGTIYP